MKHIFLAALASICCTTVGQASTFTFVTALPSTDLMSGVQNGVGEGALGPVTPATIGNGIIPALDIDLDLPTAPLSQTLDLSNGSRTTVTSSLTTGLTQSTAESRLTDQNVALSFGAVDVLLQNTGSQRITIAPGALRFEADGLFSRDVGPDIGQNLGAAGNAFSAGLVILGGNLLDPFGGRIFSETVMGGGQVTETNLDGVQLSDLGPGGPANGPGVTFDDAGFDAVLASAGFFVDPGEYLFISGLVTTAAGSTTGSSAFTDSSSTGSLQFDLPAGITVEGAPAGFFLSDDAPTPPTPAPVPLPATAWLFLSAFGLFAACRSARGRLA